MKKTSFVLAASIAIAAGTAALWPAARATVTAADGAVPEKDKTDKDAKAGAATPEEGKAAKEKEKAPDPSLGGLPGDPAATGILAGRVVATGKLPELKPNAVPADNKDRTTCGHEIPNERIVLGPGNAVANVIVSLDKVPNAPKPAKRQLGLDNLHCRFVPHVQATVVGSSLKVTSQDAILHSANALITNEFNISVYPDKPVERTLLRPGWMAMKCATHSWMDAHIWVFPHDFFAVTSKEGTFRIQGIPPGKYKVKVWHEGPLEPVEREVNIEAGKSSELAVELKPYEG